MNDMLDVVIVGAGPYGLSIAAHLQKTGMRFRIFGSPFRMWREHMPKGMYLKSDGFASNLSDPDGIFTLKRYCEQENIPYDDLRIPVELATFNRYGLEFQRRFVPDLINKDVVAVDQVQGGFRVELEGGESVLTQKLILAVGISHFANIPDQLAHLPSSFFAHSSEHHDWSFLRGRKVTTIGAGASAIGLAGILRDDGIETSIIARRNNLVFHDPPGDKPRPLLKQLRHPNSGLGPGWRSRIYSDLPQYFPYLPKKIRMRILRTHLKPAAGWPVKPQVEGKVHQYLGKSIEKAEVLGDKVHLHLRSADGTSMVHMTDFVIAGTGYKPSVRRLKFLSSEIQAKIATVEDAPLLSQSFESSVSGLYFVGAAAANTFGPLLRFAFGSNFTAHHITKHLTSGRVMTDELRSNSQVQSEQTV